MLFRKNSSPRRWGAVFLQYCRPLPAIFNVFAPPWWLKIHCFPFVFQYFCELDDFCWRCTKKSWKILEKQQVEKKRLPLQCRAVFSKYTTQISHFFLHFFFLCLTFSSFQRLYVASRGARRGGQGRSQTRRLYFPKTCSLLKQEAKS